ncbi:hypothetical protein P5673_008662 [Acropora cervicornis]|uniref:Uncharacterized protein n=1 Tax=Acropora cervicornis TaxID=6130 RepID=A0AAD9QSU1_ACRCE|nr:hypothetical protein P5673_008662 [Acropora cervicornis]
MEHRLTCLNKTSEARLDPQIESMRQINVADIPSINKRQTIGLNKSVTSPWRRLLKSSRYS